jgi:lytic murein transglycosylase
MTNLPYAILTRCLGALVLGLGLAILLTSAPLQAQSGVNREAVERQFRQWLDKTLWPEAARAGVSERTFRRAFDGVTLDWSMPELSPPGARPDRPQPQTQAEFSSPGKYFSEKRLATLEKDGRAFLQKWSKTLDRIEKQYGVPREIIVAIWGRESHYGQVKIPHDAIRTLATAAFMGRRKPLFHAELIAALRILEEEHITHDAMKSSWAGALGQPQFMPSKYLRYAVDFDGDGHRNIWTSVPDTLASIANYLRQHGWVPGSPWGVEIALPERVSCTEEGPLQGRPVSAWNAAGIRQIDGRPLPNFPRQTFLMAPAGRLGPAFIVSENFYVLKHYNESDLYALFIGHLADRYRKGRPMVTPWAEISGFTRQDVRRLQDRLMAAGLDVGKPDGLIGFKSRIAVGIWQNRNGMRETCFPDRALVMGR